MEQLQLKRESVQLEDHGRPETQIGQPLLVSARTLVEQCRGCSNELQRLAEQALEYAEISVFARTILHPIAGQLKDVHLRLDIWMSDIDIENGTLTENDAFKQSRLFSVITTALQRMTGHLDAVGKDLAIIKYETELIRRIEHVTFPRRREFSLTWKHRQREVSGAKQAEARISDALSAMTSVLRNLADLATSIQMFHAIQTNQGPYSELHAQVSSLKDQPEESLAQIPAEVTTSAGGDDEDQCPNCRRWFSLNDLATHVGGCPKTEVMPSTQPEPPKPSKLANTISNYSSSASLPRAATPLFKRDTRTDLRPTSKAIRYSEDRIGRTGTNSRGPIPLEEHNPQGLFSQYVGFTPEKTLNHSHEQVQRPETENFVLRLQAPYPHIAIDVPAVEAAWDTILSDDTRQGTQWINVWDVGDQRVALNAMAKFYQFSPLLMKDLFAPERKRFPRYKPRNSRKAMPSLSRLGKKRSDEKDIEYGTNEYAIEHNGKEYSVPDSRPVDIWETGSDSLQSTFLTVDQRYICIAYNRNYDNVVQSSDSPENIGRLKSGEDLEQVRSWLILCDEGTVISIHRKSYPEAKKLYGGGDRTSQRLRTHALEVLERLSKLPSSEEGGPVRISESVPRAKQDASTLFYWLYDDSKGFFSAIAPVIRQYEGVLDKLREDVGEGPPSILDISELEALSLQLSELHRSFQTSDKLIDQLLDPSLDYYEIDDSTFAKGVTPRDIQMSYPARMLFRRLRRRIYDHCLCKVQSLVEEKHALSRVWSQITRSAQMQTGHTLGLEQAFNQRLIIALLTLILMSTYFSNSIENLRGVYTVTTYWVTFTVIVVLNAIFLVSYSLRQIPPGHDGLLRRYLDLYFAFLPVELRKRF
ncbi:hypothetical protein MMC30_000483 [Trapelia coarctata]|nr:hypothetical protein [Trapelia coarctata]